MGLNARRYTIAWIAPLPIEARAAVCLLDRQHSGAFPMQRGDDYVFMAGEVCGHNIVIATLPAGQESGTGSAAALASQVKKYFPNLWFGLLVGVAAGLPQLSGPSPRDIRLGDVLVALPDGKSAGLVAYDLGKETADGFQPLKSGHVLAETETVVRSAIGNIRLRAPNDSDIILPYYEQIKDQEHTGGTFADPGQDADTLYRSDESGVPIPIHRKSRPTSRRTRIWYGPIGSGEKVMENPAKRDRLRDLYGLIGLEREAAGIMNRIPVGVIRGVCDYGDEHKNKAWLPYAAAMAGAYAKAVLAQIGQESDSTGLQDDMAVAPISPENMAAMHAHYEEFANTTLLDAAEYFLLTRNGGAIMLPGFDELELVFKKWNILDRWHRGFKLGGECGGESENMNSFINMLQHVSYILCLTRGKDPYNVMVEILKGLEMRNRMYNLHDGPACLEGIGTTQPEVQQVGRRIVFLITTSTEGGGTEDTITRIVSAKGGEIQFRYARQGGEREDDYAPFVALQSDKVDWKHCKMILRQDKWYLQDQGSARGTWLNQRRLSAPGEESGQHPLKRGDQINLAMEGGTSHSMLRILVHFTRGYVWAPPAAAGRFDATEQPPTRKRQWTNPLHWTRSVPNLTNMKERKR